MAEALASHNIKVQLASHLSWTLTAFILQVASLQEEIDLLGNQMANTAFNVPIYESSREINNPNNMYQFSSQMDIENYLSQQTPTEANQAFYSETNTQLAPMYGWEEQTSHFYNDPNISETLFEGMDQDIFMHYPWMGTLNLWELKLLDKLFRHGKL